MSTIEKNYRATGLSVVICFGDYGFLNRLKMLYFLLLGRTVRFSGDAIRSTRATDIKEIP